MSKADMRGWALTKIRMSLPPLLAELRQTSRSSGLPLLDPRFRSCIPPISMRSAMREQRLRLEFFPTTPLEEKTSLRVPLFGTWRRHDTLERECRRNISGELPWPSECAGELRGDTSRTGAHRLLPRPRSVLSGTIGSCRGQSAAAIRRRVVSSDYWGRPSKV